MGKRGSYFLKAIADSLMSTLSWLNGKSDSHFNTTGLQSEYMRHVSTSLSHTNKDWFQGRLEAGVPWALCLSRSHTTKEMVRPLPAK